MWCPYITKRNNYRKNVLVITSFGGLSVLMLDSLELLFEARMKTKELYFKKFPHKWKIIDNELAHKLFGVLWHKEGCAHELAVAWFSDYKGEISKDGSSPSNWFGMC
jgi:hypothetical protein